ncbi:hypothetical protein LPJ78_003456 [Coemansia sp. RSA 989]|nr:hypothetical protein LPJ78_003456 [Coemansia sp. RSA 989]KAJ1871935.1 hypothetical protein LPJ55_003514 [Coemansia sp. RSA 990]
MPPKTSEEAKRARDAALEFLNELGDGEEASSKLEDASKDAEAAATAESNKDAQGMLKFIDDLTESAKRSTSPASVENKDALEQPAQTADSGGWSWGGIWGQAAALVEHNAQLKSGLGRLKSSIEHVRNTEASKSIESRVRTIVNQENITKLSGDFKRQLDTVIDTIAPPIPDHEVFSVHLVSSMQDSSLENAIYRTMDRVFDFHGCGAVNIKSASQALAEAPEMQVKRGDTFTLPKGFDGGYGAAVTAVQYIQNTLKMQAREREDRQKAAESADKKTDDGTNDKRSESPMFYRAHKTELLLAIQPFSAIPMEDQGFLGLCVVLRDPSRNVTLRTFSQMLPLSCWAQPHDQIVAVDVDASLGSSVNMRADDAVQRKQEMNEECLHEAVMLAVKAVANEYLASRPAAAKAD